MQVKVLGTGCAKCKKLHELAAEAIAKTGVKAELSKVEKIDDIMAYGVMMTPALVVGDEVKVSGKVPSLADISTWLTTAAAKEGA